MVGHYDVHSWRARGKLSYRIGLFMVFIEKASTYKKHVQKQVHKYVLLQDTIANQRAGTPEEPMSFYELLGKE